MYAQIDLSVIFPWVAGTLAAVVALVAAEHSKSAAWRALLKTTAALGFVGLAVTHGQVETGVGLWILIGLLLSLTGDICLLPRGAGGSFLAGIGAFLLAHLAYLGAFLHIGVDFSWLIGSVVLLGPIGWAIHRWLSPDVSEKLRLPVLIYIVVIIAMVAGAIGAWGRDQTLYLLPITAGLFMLSDVGVAMTRFKSAGISTKIWASPSYFVAQLMFAIHTMMGL